MMRTPSLAVALALTLALTSIAPLATAQPNEVAVAAARELAQEGYASYTAADYATAADKLGKAYAVVQVPSVAAWLGESLERTGRWVEAAERYREAMLLSVPDTSRELHHKAQQTARERLEALAPKIPKLEISIEGAASDEVSLTIDDQPVPSAVLATAIPIDPGEHRVVALRGEQRVEQRVTASEGATQRVVLSLPVVAPPPPPPPSPPPPPPPPATKPAARAHAAAPQHGAWMTPAGWAAVGVGGASLVVGAITGGLLLSKDADLDAACDDDACVPSAQDDVDTFNTLRPVTTIALVVGAVGVTTGVALLVMAPGESEQTALVLTPTGAWLRHRW